MRSVRSSPHNDFQKPAQVGLSEIALIPGTLAFMSTLATAPWWVWHLWHQSTLAAALFAISAFVCGMVIMIANLMACGGQHGVPHLTGYFVGLGLAGLQLYFLWQLHQATAPFSLGQALLLNHAPGYAGAAVFLLRWVIVTYMGDSESHDEGGI